MKLSLKAIFKKEKNIIIGAVHLPPLLGFPDFPGTSVALGNALSDLRAFELGGVDGVIFENNYDNPHTANVKPGTIACMALIGQHLREATKLPLGVSVLWNDYESALVLGKLLNLQFVRVPVFVDDVKTQYGVFRATPKEIITRRKALRAQGTALFADIHVKHATLLSKRTIEQSAKLAIQKKADALLVTGEWTGQAPAAEELKKLRSEVSRFPLFLASGVNTENARDLLQYANGAIVSTSLKKGIRKQGEVNVKSYSQRIDAREVRRLVSVLRK